LDIETKMYVKKTKLYKKRIGVFYVWALYGFGLGVLFCVLFYGFYARVLRVFYEFYAFAYVFASVWVLCVFYVLCFYLCVLWVF